MSAAARAAALRAPLGCAALWAAANALMNLDLLATRLTAADLLRVSPEAALLAALAAAAAGLGASPRWRLHLPLGALAVFLQLFRTADALVPRYFFRPFNLYIDAQFLPDLADLLRHTLPPARQAAWAAAGLLAAAVLGAAATGAARCLHAALRRGRGGGRWLPWAVCAAALAVAAGGSWGRLPAVAPGILHRVAAEADFILHVKGYRSRKLEAIRRTADELSRLPATPSALGGADVYLIFIESYGHVLFSGQERYRTFAPYLRQWEETLREKGFHAASAFLRSPAFGGSSWLAHATVASGVPLGDQLAYDLLVTSQAPTMARIFGRAGYRTVSAMPGTRWPWPQAAFFGFHQHYFAWDFGYHGPAFGWSPMPDQYVLQQVYEKEIARRPRVPLFLELVLISSHAPFHRQPPYVEDWSQIGDGRLYHRLPAVSFPVHWPDLSNAAGAYLAAAVYEMRVLCEFILRYADKNALFVLLGDHQPNAQLTAGDDSWSVPVHVISGRPEFVRAFERLGYRPGLVPDQPPPHPGMERFLPELLRLFGARPSP